MSSRKIHARHLVFASPLTGQERLVRDICKALQEAGLKVYQPKFPFGMHHEYYRTKLRPRGRHARRSEIAALMEGWASTRENPDDYIWQGICGGLLQYLQTAPDHASRIPQDIAGRLEVLRWGDEFHEWAAAEITPRA